MKFAASLTLLATQRFLQAWAAPAPNPQEADATNEGPRATNEPIRDPIDPPPGLVMEPQLPPQVYANFSYSDEQFWFGDLDPAKAIEEILKCPDLACEPGMAIPFDPAFHTTTEDGKRHRVVMKVDGSFNNLGLPGNKLQLVQLAKAAFEVLYETKAVENAPEESFIVNACAPWAVSGCPGREVVTGRQYHGVKHLTIRVNTDSAGSSGGDVNISFEREEPDLGGLCSVLTMVGVIGAAFGPAGLAATSNLGVVLGIGCGIATSLD